MILFIVIAILICVLIAHYFTWRPSNSDTYYNHQPLWFAHRGAFLTAPENTLSAYIEAQHKNIPAIELDVVSTKDGIVVCSHNFDLERKTNGFGYIHELNYSELKQVKNGRLPNGPYEKIATLEEALNVIKYPVRINIEIKTFKIFEFKTAIATAKIVKRKQLVDRVMLSSFNPITLWVIKTLYQSILTGYIIKERFMLLLVHVSRADFIHPRSDLVTKRLLQFARKKGMRINVWTVNTKPAIDWLIEQGVDGIITDRLEYYSE
ncbi:MAG: hypothetical protein IIB95_00685 [Candidatus Marinimicrobia bacterium]|nr:hypothetical protein [Candidatus Neomarinimicrobiota bacterium]MCH7762240.1 hypothetical protein [Candidatus Neomarinimicrobiota bacterium]